ncbi:hypothetical protein BH23THE1_BH23THE1_26760 [soil metagenome]
MQMQANNESSHVRVIVLINAKEGKKEELLKLLVPLVDPPRKREGNLFYTFNSSIDNPNELLFDEVWDTRESYNKHYESNESVALRSKIQDLVSRPIEFKIFKEITSL